MQKGYLVLENGEIFTGKLLGDIVSQVVGECVFNTSMNGYQEIITDPSYAGQILTFTYPHIGNYGTGEYGYEAKKPALRGLVIKEITEVNGHYESQWTITEFLKRHNITCLTEIDTRRLTRILRQEGSMGGIITPELDCLSSLITKAKAGKDLLDSDLVSQVTCQQLTSKGRGKRIIVWDFGCKESIVRELIKRECEVVLAPAYTTAEQIIELNPQGVVLSNGPGNPQVCNQIIYEIKKIWGKIPMFGICLGHQLLALAAGANTFKLKFGHRGANHTVKDTRTGKCSITSQNHGYAVEERSLAKTGLNISFVNLNDNTIEGMFHKELPIMSVQFHPEASPGPYDTHSLFDEFLNMTN